MKECTQQEYIDFIKNYPRKLDVDINAIAEPPLKTVNDFTLGDWPNHVVASCRVFKDDPYFTNVMNGYLPSRHGDYLEADWKIKPSTSPT